MTGSDPKQIARELLEEAHPALIGLSHWIHANPELGYQEVLASGWVQEWLTTAGFDVRTGVGEMPTALVGSYGPGPFHVAICVEYDALPAVGHACGHNVIAAAGVGAGLALASVADQLGLKVTVLGTPAEETGGGKIGLIKAGELDKVVLARDVVATADGPVDVRHLLVRLAAAYPSCWTFSVDGLVGATPELLVRRTGDLVTSRVLAGTVRRRGDDQTDAGLARALLASDKDTEEHEYAVRSVARALAAHCTDLDVPSRPHVLELANVQHLATDVTGRLADSATVLALAASLHPTAAVCGTPTERAFALIAELEQMDRGRYAGPVGWFDRHGDGEFGIALRCARVEDDQVRAFAGCGIVAGSEPADEVAESNAKLIPMREALGG